MKTIIFALLLWGGATQSFAIMTAPIVDKSYEDQREFTVELKSIGYFYTLRIYDAHHILLDSTIQFTRGYDLDAFLVDGDNGSLEVLVVMSLDEDSEGFNLFSFDGHSLSKLSDS